MRRHRPAVATLLALLAAVVAGGCSAPAAKSSANLYHRGEISIGTGNTTALFYTLGSGYASIISTNLPGYEALAAATPGSVDNLRRLGSGDIDVAFTFASNAADALVGQNQFAGHPLPVRALARIHNNYTHVIVRDGSGINTFSDLRAHRVSTGPHGSGTESTADRMLTLAGIDPGKDIHPFSASLSESVADMVDGSIDAMFWSAGLPTPGIAELFAKAAGQVHLLPVDSLLPAMKAAFGAGVYSAGSIPRSVYGTPEDVATVVEPNLLMVRADLPEELQYQLTKLLFEHQKELVAINSAAKEIIRSTGAQTGPVTLAPGAARYYANG